MESFLGLEMVRFELIAGQNDGLNGFNPIKMLKRAFELVVTTKHTFRRLITFECHLLAILNFKSLSDI